jgi:hypothetical protein
MNTHPLPLRHPAGAALAIAAVAGLVLAGCSTASSGSSGSDSTASKAAGSSSAGTNSGSGNSGGSTSVVSSASVPFPISVGNTWKYADTQGTISSGTSVDKIASVTPVSGGQQVTMDSAITTLGITTNSTGYFIFHSDGSISYPFTQFNTGHSATRVRLLSGNILWPSAADLASGKAYHDTLVIEFTISGKKQKLVSHITVRGGGTASVTVPAGSYSATIVEMTEAATVEGIGVNTEVKTWLASGVGPVKSEVIINEGGTSHVADVNQLTSFTKG